ncbi:hypothetical protein HMI54_005616 [Coelomomyces lativittatus]|nr:hypothetical protein HMI54_005616 [Coelomomyces lativittatus]
MLKYKVKFERPLKGLLNVLLTTHEKPPKTSIRAQANFKDYVKFGVEIYNFEKKFRANVLKFSSNSEKRTKVSVQTNENASNQNEFLWNCNEPMGDIIKKESFSLNLLCLIIAYKLKKAIAKAHPGIPEVLWKPTVDEKDTERLSLLDEEKIFIFQNTERKLNRIIVKTGIDDLENEQRYDTLVIPSDVYRNAGSMQNFKRIYQEFWDELNINDIFKCLVLKDNKNSATPEDFTISKKFKDMFRLMYPCLKALDEKEFKDKEVRGCTEELLRHLEEQKKSFVVMLDACKSKRNIHLPLSSNLRILQIYLVSWVLSMEWVATYGMTQTYTINLGLKSKVLKREYNYYGMIFESEGRKRSSEISTGGHSKASKKKRKTSRKPGSSEDQNDNRALNPNFQNTQFWNQMDSLGNYHNPNQQSNNFEYPPATLNNLGPSTSQMNTFHSEPNSLHVESFPELDFALGSQEATHSNSDNSFNTGGIYIYIFLVLLSFFDKI